MEIELYDVILINMITYMAGIFTGFGFCIKYKHKLFRSKSQENLAQLQGHNTSSPVAGQAMSHANFGQYPAVMASAPSHSALKEVVIRSTE